MNANHIAKGAIAAALLGAFATAQAQEPPTTPQPPCAQYGGPYGNPNAAPCPYGGPGMNYPGMMGPGMMGPGMMGPGARHPGMMWGPGYGYGQGNPAMLEYHRRLHGADSVPWWWNRQQ